MMDRRMSRYRMYPTPQQEVLMREHCRHARYVWNLALEQTNYYRPAFGHTPNRNERDRQLTEVRAEFEWLAAGSRVVQAQALRDFEQAMQNWWGATHGYPTWRKEGRNNGFRVVGQDWRIRQINRRWSEVSIPKIGWVRFRRSRPVPEAKSYRVTLDASGRWHIAFAVIPKSTDGPGDGSIVGIDRGITKTLALSDGTSYQAPVDRSVKRLQRQLARCQPGSNRRAKVKKQLAKVYAKNVDTCKDWVEKTSTTIVRSYDLIRIEDLSIQNMTRSAKGTIEKPGKNVRQKAGLNREILKQGWGAFARRLQEKAPGRVEKINPRNTSRRCSVCNHVAKENRKSQALFLCVQCGHRANADLNAAINIAAGHAGTARRGMVQQGRPLKREPQLALA